MALGRLRNIKTNQFGHFAYDKLEPRQLLAATLYVDFGAGFGDQLTISDAESSSLGGPEIFGDGFAIESFTRRLGNFGQSFEAVASRIESNLNDAFSPFDVDISFVESTSLAEIESQLSATSTNDAYVFVGDMSPTESADFGEALLDGGNSGDNLAFVFARGIFTTTNNDQSIANSIAKQAAHTFGLMSVDYDIPVFEGTNPDPFTRSLHAIMAEVGTAADGEAYSSSIFKGRSAFFHRIELPTIRENGVSAGVQNSYELLATNVGVRPNQPAYLTGFWSNKEIELTSSGVDSVDVRIDDMEWQNVDVSNGLDLRLSEWTQSDESILLMLDHAIMSDINIETYEWNFLNKKPHVQMLNGAVDAVLNDDHSLDINGNIHLSQAENLETGDFDDTIVVDSNRFSLATAGGNDEVTVRREKALLSLDLGAGDDAVHAHHGLIISAGEGLVSDGEDKIIRAGEGNDKLDFSMATETTPELSVRIEEDSYVLYQLEVEIEEVPGFGQFVLEFEHTLEGFEHFVGSDTTHGSIVRDSTPIIVDWEVDGRFMNFSTGAFSSDEVLENFSMLNQRLVNFGAIDDTILNRFYQNIYVKSTAYPLEFTNASLVQIGSSEDVNLGNTEDILHDIKVGMHLTERYTLHELSKIVVSNINGGATDSIWVRTQDESTVVSGITSADVIVDYSWPFGKSVFIGPTRFKLSVHGSDLRNDYALVTGTRVKTELFGHGGKDVFFVGSTDVGMRGNLDWVTADILIDGGEAKDRLYIDDHQSPTARNYTFDDWFTVINDDGSSGARIRIDQGVEKVELFATEFSDQFTATPFGSADIHVFGAEGTDRLYIEDHESLTGRNYAFFDNWLTIASEDGLSESRFRLGQGLEIVELNATEFADQFTVAPNLLTEIVIDANAGNNSLTFDHPNPEIAFRRGVTGGNQWMFEGLKPVTYLDANTYTDKPSLIATASLEGTATSVLIRNASDNSIVRKFDLFGIAYTGGANVALADVTGDGVDDLLVAARRDLAPIVWVYDTATGLFVTKIQPFGSQYREGVNLATGNIVGDERNEIIVSKMDGRPLVRVYSYVPNSSNFKQNNYYFPMPELTSGAAVAAADMDGDGFDDVIAATTDGQQAVVTIHSVSAEGLVDERHTLQKRVVVLETEHHREITVGAFQTIGNSLPDLFVGAASVGASSQLSGSIYLFDNQTIAGSENETLIESDRQILAYAESTSPVDFAIRDLNGDGSADRLFVTNTSGSRIVKTFDSSQYGNWYQVDSYFENDPNLSEGISIG